jgi:hypothetical protein
MASQKVAESAKKHININILSWTRGLLMGGGMAYAYENKKPWYHYPLAFIAAAPYAGYHTYRNRDIVSNYLTLFSTSRN